MDFLKFAIRDYESTTNDRLVDFRRHVNTIIQGGGGQMSKSGKISKDEKIVDSIIFNLRLLYAQRKPTKLQRFKNSIGLPELRLPGEENPTRESWRELKQFMMMNPQLRNEEYIAELAKIQAAQEEQAPQKNEEEFLPIGELPQVEELSSISEETDDRTPDQVLEETMAIEDILEELKDVSLTQSSDKKDQLMAIINFYKNFGIVGSKAFQQKIVNLLQTYIRDQFNKNVTFENAVTLMRRLVSTQ